MIERKGCCPKCGYRLLARKDNLIICLSTTCNWSIESKRKEDNELKYIAQLKEEWQ